MKDYLALNEATQKQMSEQTRPKESKRVDDNQGISTNKKMQKSSKVPSEPRKSAKQDSKYSAKSQQKKSEPPFRESN